MRDKLSVIGLILFTIVASICIVALITGFTITLRTLHTESVERDRALRETMIGNPYTREYANRILNAKEDHGIDIVMKEFFTEYVGIPEDEYRWLYSNRARMVKLISEGQCTWGFGKVKFTKDSDYYLETGRQ